MGGGGRVGKKEEGPHRSFPGVPLTFARAGTMMRGTRTANDTFKQSYRTKLAFGLIAAVAVHFALFSLFPKMHANRLAAAEGELDSVAQKVAERMVFSPAFNRDKKTAVWLSQSIDFDVG